EYNLHPLCNQQRVYKKTKFNVFGLFCFFCVCAVGIVFLEVESVFISILTSFFALLLLFFYLYSFMLRGRRVYSLYQQTGSQSSGEYKRHQLCCSERHFL
ncbi:hypothetical protein, partial [Escherichia coli]|uniref:hypothetical protein n=1 Tax=Escherichia coli TaxID=562 RepID=UPI001BB01DA5